MKTWEVTVGKKKEEGFEELMKRDEVQKKNNCCRNFFEILIPILKKKLNTFSKFETSF